MKVLVCHNRYRSAFPSGENRYVDYEIALLRDAGIDVIPMIEENDSIINGGPLQMANAGLGLLYSPTGVRRFQRLLREERPDIVYIHNVFPLISPAVIRIAKAAGTPVVAKIHNNGHSCIRNGVHVRDGLRCEECLGRPIPLPAIQHRCYLGSRTLSAARVLAKSAHRGTWRMVDKFLVPSPFMGFRLITAGIDEKQITVFPTYTPDPGEPTTSPGEDFLFIGRLEEEKGILLLLDAWRSRTRRGTRRLRIGGSGPLEERVRSTVRNEDDVEYLGYLQRDQVLAEMQNCGVVAAPSLYEGPSVVAVDALAQGRPVMMNRLTGYPSFVSDEYGWRVEPTAGSWREALDTISQDEIEARGLAGRKHYVATHSPSTAIPALIKIYESVLGRDAQLSSPQEFDVLLVIGIRAECRLTPADPSGL
jgi:glycosyltransferase involved in cell wall biosynthesis